MYSLLIGCLYIMRVYITWHTQHIVVLLKYTRAAAAAARERISHNDDETKATERHIKTGERRNRPL